MDGTLWLLALVILALVVLDVAALKWGADSRPVDRENALHQAI